MNCAIVASLITPYIDNELSDEIKLQVNEHLEGCTICRKEFELQSDVHHLLKEKLNRVLASANVRNSISEIFQKPKVSHRRWLMRSITVSFRPITGLAVTAVLIIGLFIGISVIIKGVKKYTPLTSSSIISTETAPIAQGVATTITGEVICIECYLKKQFNANCDCMLQGHHSYGIIDKNGQLWSFAVNTVSESLAKSGNILGKIIQIECQMYPCAHFISIQKYQFSSSNEQK
jgi:hypothetical protein